MNKSDLKLDWATHEAAKYACAHWHYSKCMPVGKLLKIGVWEKSKFIGVVLFGRGANRGLLSPYGLKQTQGCELTRIALTSHESYVSRIIALAISFVSRKCSNMRLIISFADSSQGHHGGIYQATNWIYTGMSNAAYEYIYNGKRWHGRAFRKSHGSHLKYIDKGLKIVKGAAKHRYLMPLDAAMRKKLETLAKPYPKRVRSSTVEQPAIQPADGGSSPTRALQ